METMHGPYYWESWREITQALFGNPGSASKGELTQMCIRLHLDAKEGTPRVCLLFIFPWLVCCYLISFPHLVFLQLHGDVRTSEMGERRPGKGRTGPSHLHGLFTISTGVARSRSGKAAGFSK